jgi:outer membrane lipase/esterase
MGNNYAIGGARAGADAVFPGGIPILSANNQVDGYLAANQVDPNGLYVVWAGANDLLAAAGNPANAQATILGAVGSQIETINVLKDNGANYILVPNIPDVGLTPNAIVGGPVAQAQSTGATQLYNQFMINGVAGTGSYPTLLQQRA